MSDGFSAIVAADVPTTLSKVREALAAEGFGVLTEIDLASTLRVKVGAELEDYVILGACNPPLAYGALQVEPGIGLLLPCNVVVRTIREGTLVEAVDPATLVTVTGNAELAPVAAEVAERLRRVITALAG